MLKVDNLQFSYSKNGRLVLNGASLELKQGEIGSKTSWALKNPKAVPSILREKTC